MQTVFSIIRLTSPENRIDGQRIVRRLPSRNPRYEAVWWLSRPRAESVRSAVTVGRWSRAVAPFDRLRVTE